MGFGSSSTCASCVIQVAEQRRASSFAFHRTKILVFAAAVVVGYAFRRFTMVTKHGEIEVFGIFMIQLLMGPTTDGWGEPLISKVDVQSDLLCKQTVDRRLQKIGLGLRVWRDSLRDFELWIPRRLGLPTDQNSSNFEGFLPSSRRDERFQISI